MPDEHHLSERLRALADEPAQTSMEARSVMLAAARELEERACRIGELHASVERLREQLQEARASTATEQRPTTEHAAHPTLIPGLRTEPAPRRAVLIRARYGHLDMVNAIVRCGPAGAVWRLRTIDHHGMLKDEEMFRVELEPVAPHMVPLDVSVRELPFPWTDLGWVPAAGTPEALTYREAVDEAMSRR